MRLNPRRVRALLACFAFAALLIPSTASAGRLLVTGHDTDVHCRTSGVETGPHCHFIHTAIDYVRATAPDPTKPILLVSCSSNLAASVSSAYNGFPMQSTTVCPTDVSFATAPIDVSHYSAMVVATAFSGMGSAPSAALNARKADVEAFFNAGGGIFANSGFLTATYYDFLPLAVGAGSNTSPYALTAAGQTIGLQDSTHGIGTFNDINCCATHNSFTEPAGGSPIVVAERDANLKPITMIAEGAISGGVIVAPSAPETRIDSAPDAQSAGDSATLTFSSTPDGAIFECRVDGGGWASCTSPMAVAGLAAGDHTFEVRGTSNGLTDATPALAAWTVSAPAAAPAPAPPAPPDPAPAVVLPVANPHVSAVLGNQTPGASAGADVTVRADDTLAVGCRMHGADLGTCSVTAYAGGASARASALPIVGHGSTTVRGAGHRTASVRMRLNALGRRVLHGALAGVSVRLRIDATVYGQSTRMRTTRTARLRPARQLIVPATGQFPSLVARLDAAQRRYVRSVARALAGARSVTCTGHTSSAPGAIHSAANVTLGLRRAQAVCHALVHDGFKGRIRVRSAGDRHPRAGNDTARGQALNRRVELLVVR